MFPANLSRVTTFSKLLCNYTFAVVLGARGRRAMSIAPMFFYFFYSRDIPVEFFSLEAYISVTIQDTPMGFGIPFNNFARNILAEKRFRKIFGNIGFFDKKT